MIKQTVDRIESVVSSVNDLYEKAELGREAALDSLQSLGDSKIKEIDEKLDWAIRILRDNY